MLSAFILSNRREIIANSCRTIALRSGLIPDETPAAVPVFLNFFLSQLVNILSYSCPDDGMKRTAAIHGGSMLGLGYSVSHVVHDYGDIGKAIICLALKCEIVFTVQDFYQLCRCIDSAVSAAVTEYERLRDQNVARAETERIGIFAHELRNKMSAATLAYQSIVSGRSPVKGGVSAVVTRNLINVNDLIEREINQVRVDSGNCHQKRIHLYQFMEEAGSDGMVSANARGISLKVSPTPREIDIDVDQQILAGAVSNLLQNAFKFTPQGGQVLLRTSVLDHRVLIDVADECGGLPIGKNEELFRAFEQRGTNRSGLGLGLFISRKGVEANNGSIHVQDIPGSGCVFTIDLPLAS
jgi:hypothetical protein